MTKISSKKIIKSLIKKKSKSTANRLKALIAILVVSIFASNFLQQIDTQNTGSNPNTNISQK
jgi:hypothetical protein